MDKIGMSGNFSGSTTIVGIKFGEKCTFVDENAFGDCTSLEKINDDNVIEEIGSHAFKGCVALPSAIFNKLTSLGTNVFENCTNLKHISIPKISEIPNSTFEGCSNLLYIDIPNKETFEIGENAFKSCDKLESVNITDTTNTTILNSAFAGCKSLDKINIENCLSIGEQAFYDCSNLSQITLSKCELIKKNAFTNCTNLSRVNIYPLSEGICKLENTKVFFNSDDTLNDILFYVHPDIYNSYIGADNWVYYYGLGRMLLMVGTNQIIYKTASNKKIDDIYINNDLKHHYIEKHAYTTFGNIEFSDKNIDSDSEYNECVVTTLEKIFKNIDNINSISDSDSDSDNNVATTPLDITSIDIPSQCVTIDKYAFEGLENLKSITFPKSLKTIDEYAFKDCKGFTSFKIPETVETLGEGVFAGCTEVKTYEGKFTSQDGKMVICNNTLICVSPKDDKFVYNISDIDNNITKLGKSCFYGCENLRRVDIPPTITKIGDNAFEGCSNLNEIHFYGNTPPELGENIFGDINVNDIRSDFKIFVPLNMLQEYLSAYSNYVDYIYPTPPSNAIIIYSDVKPRINIIHNNVKIYEANIDNHHYYITSNNVSNIPSNLFTNATKDDFTKIILGENIHQLNSEAFSGCNKLEYIYLPDRITSIGYQCFKNCSSLTKIHIPSLSSFGTNIFDGCKSLKEFGTYNRNKMNRVSDDGRCYISNGNLLFFAPFGADKTYKIPNDVKQIFSYVFYGCDSLTGIDIPDEVTSIGMGVFQFCSGLETINIPTKLSSIESYTFCGCSNLTNVTIPDSVTSIGQEAFCDCARLTDVTIGNGITSIGSWAFGDCNQLKNVYCTSTTPPTGSSGMFNNNDSERKIYVHSKSVSAYKSASYWSDYASYIIGYNFETGQPDNEIWYTSSDENIVIPIETDVFGANIVSNTYENGKGIIKFDSDITSIGKQAFWYCKSLTTITIPDGVTSIGDYVFFGCTSLTSVTIGNGVTSIGEYAFWECSSLTTITIPDSVTSIGSGAFYNCTSLTSVTIPDSVTEIGGHAFSTCSSLTSITIPNRVTSIGERAFISCTSLTSVTIPDSVTSIGGAAFSICSSLQAFYGKYTSADNHSLIVNGVLNSFAPIGLIEYTIPDSVTSIGDYVFYDCNSLTSVTIGKRVNSIGEFAFHDCDSLTNITIPDSVTSIGQNVFSNCTSLTSVTIGNSVTSIGFNAFTACSSLTEVYCKPITPPTGSSSMFNSNASGRKIYVPNNSVDAYKSAKYWKNYASDIVGTEFPIENNEIWYTSSDSNIITPSTTNVFGANIVSNTYKNGMGIIKFDGDVTSIGVRAFNHCTSLTSITIPDSVTEIRGHAFRSCTSLTSVTIPDSVILIGNDAFQGCKSLTSITIGNGVTSIEISAFSDCTSLTSVTIPDSVTSIGQYTFYKCTSLTSITIPDSVTSIGSEAFRDCTSLTSVTIPDSVTLIGGGIFYNCEKLSSVYCKATTPPSGDSYMFDNNATGRKIYVPHNSVNAYKSAEYWKNYATNIVGFYYDVIYDEICYKSSDGNIITPSATNVFGANIVSNTYKNGTGIIKFDGDVTSIGVRAFEDCSRLTSITIPNSVETIGEYAFHMCTSMVTITIPSNVTSIGEGAFKNCTSTTTVYCEPTNPPTCGKYVFDNNASNRRIGVKDNSLSGYKLEWTSYSNSIYPISVFNYPTTTIDDEL